MIANQSIIRGIDSPLRPLNRYFIAPGRKPGVFSRQTPMGKLAVFVQKLFIIDASRHIAIINTIQPVMNPYTFRFPRPVING